MILLLIFSNCRKDDELPVVQKMEEIVVVANSLSGSITFIESKTYQGTKRLKLQVRIQFMWFMFPQKIKFM